MISVVVDRITILRELKQCMIRLSSPDIVFEVLIDLVRMAYVSVTELG